jgi:hypothetical protein
MRQHSNDCTVLPAAAHVPLTICRVPHVSRRSRNSRCLKLYCECFASGRYCFACNCQGCHNNPENDDKRKVAIQATLDR